MKIEKEQYVTWAHTKKLLEKKAKDGELGYEQKNAVEFLRKFNKITETKGKQLAEDLKQIAKLKEKNIVMLVNMLPSNMDEMNTLFAHEIVTLTEDEKKKILGIVKKHS